jgi:hypothetical protein
LSGEVHAGYDGRCPHAGLPDRQSRRKVGPWRVSGRASQACPSRRPYGPQPKLKCDCPDSDKPFKDFAIREAVRLEFRAEVFNLTNTPFFGASNTSVTSSNFGVVVPCHGFVLCRALRSFCRTCSGVNFSWFSGPREPAGAGRQSRTSARVAAEPVNTLPQRAKPSTGAEAAVPGHQPRPGRRPPDPDSFASRSVSLPMAG